MTDAWKRDIQISVARLQGYDVLQMFIWWRTEDGKLEVLQADSTVKRQDYGDEMMPIVEISRTDHADFADKLRSAGNFLHQNPGRLALRENLKLVESHNKHLKEVIAVLENTINFLTRKEIKPCTEKKR